MLSFIQRYLLFVYRILKKLGAERFYPVRFMMWKGYCGYKSLFEDSLKVLLRENPELIRNGDAIDVGANIGYTSLVLAKYLPDGAQIFAFEPEERNFRALTENLVKLIRAGRVIPVKRAVGTTSGSCILAINPDNPADHRIAVNGSQFPLSLKSESVEMVSLDDFFGPSHPIRFVKIDVQGYEPSVLKGMKRLLVNSNDIAIYLEFMPSAIIELGQDPEELLLLLFAHGFKCFSVTGCGKLERVGKSDICLMAEKRGYIDLLFRRDEMHGEAETEVSNLNG